MTHASGTFGVKLNPQKPDNRETESAKLGRMSIEKQFYGDLEAASKGEMLSHRTDVEGSAGYVAMERVRGILHGRSRSFVLQHSAAMTCGAPQMSVTVVPRFRHRPDSGSRGCDDDQNRRRKHFYEFDFTLPALAENRQH
jgi:Protein of unknown function (DUF3224)